MLQTAPLRGVANQARTNWLKSAGVSLCCVALSLKAMGLPAQDPPVGVLRSAEGSEPWPQETVDAPELPAAPKELKQLKEGGNVQFVFYDSGRFPRKFSGETRFTINFDSKSTYRWRQMRDRTGKRYLIVRTSFREPEFQLKHQILLPITMANEQLYQSELVRHEFDHVRISTDPRFRELFTKWLQQELKVIRLEIDQTKTNDQLNEIVNSEMNDRANQIFDKMLSLIQIRYKELDQVTRHGAMPLPEDFFE